MWVLSNFRIEKVKEKMASFQDAVTPNFEYDSKKAWKMLAKEINAIKSTDYETKFIIIAATTNLIAACLQLVVGLRMESVSVVSAAIDSLLDFILGMFNLFLFKQSQREEDDDYNYGYGKLQWFGALFQWIVILFFGASLIYFSILKLVSNSPIDGIGLLLLVMLVDFAGGLLAVAYYFLRIKKTENMIVLGTLKKVYAWLIFNIGIMSGLILIYIGMHYFNKKRYFIDPIVGLVVAVYVLRTARQLLFGGFGMLMDRSLTDEETTKIEGIINAYKDKYTRRDNLRTRRSGTIKHIQFDLYFQQQKTSFREIYGVCIFLKEHIQQELGDCIVIVTPLPA